MLITIDVGNTNMVVGVFDGEDLKYTARLATEVKRTADEYGFFFKQVLGIVGGEADDVIVASVVPGCNYALAHSFRKYFNIDPMFISSDLVTSEMGLGIDCKISDPSALGADVVANIVGAVSLYKDENIIIIDFGTATTFGVLTAKRQFLGGAICCGVRTSIGALSTSTAKLPWITIAEPKSVIGADTVGSMLSGAVYGYASLVDGMIGRIEAELGEKARVVATGGMAGVIAPYAEKIDVVNRDLTLLGLRRLVPKSPRP